MKIFDIIMSARNVSSAERLKKAVKRNIRSSKVKEYMAEIFKSMKSLAQNQVFQVVETLKNIKRVIEQLLNVSGKEKQSRFAHLNTKLINANTEGEVEQF